MAATLTLPGARIGEIHIHCLKASRASARTIIGNGGVLESEVSDPALPGPLQRYIVTAP